MSRHAVVDVQPTGIRCQRWRPRADQFVPIVGLAAEDGAFVAPVGEVSRGDQPDAVASGWAAGGAGGVGALEHGKTAADDLWKKNAIAGVVVASQAVQAQLAKIVGPPDGQAATEIRIEGRHDVQAAFAWGDARIVVVVDGQRGATAGIDQAIQA